LDEDAVEEPGSRDGAVERAVERDTAGHAEAGNAGLGAGVRESVQQGVPHGILQGGGDIGMALFQGFFTLPSGAQRFDQHVPEPQAGELRGRVDARLLKVDQ
jgi:hypothetical protein